MKKIKAILFSTLLSFVITFLLIAIAALIVAKVGILPGKLLPMILMLLCCISVAVGGYCVSLVMKERGIFYGGLVGIVFVIALTSVSLCMEPRKLGVAIVWKICAILLSGAIGGILAVNRKEKVKF